MSEFQIRQDNYLTQQIVDTDLSESDIGEGEVLVKIDRFAFTANNITYAVVGDQFGYFPPATYLKMTPTLIRVRQGNLDVTCCDIAKFGFKRAHFVARNCNTESHLLSIIWINFLDIITC